MVVLKELRSHLKTICQTVGVPVFKDIELDFIDEYISVMRPVAIALDRLQGNKAESNAFMGALIPTLLMIKQKLTDLEQSTSLAHCSPLASALLQGLEKRFGVLLNLESYANEYIVTAHSLSCDGCPPTLLTGVGCCSSEHVSTETTTSATTVTANSATDPEDDFFTIAADAGHQST